jgi:hypothetical protein
MRRTWLYPLNLGVTEVVSEKMLTVGRNLDRNGQNPYLYFDSFYTYLDLVSPFLFYSHYSYLSYSRKTIRISHLGILHQRPLKEIGDLRQYIYIYVLYLK